jgi:hypothetical protein
VWGGSGVREVVSSGALVDIEQEKERKKLFCFVFEGSGCSFRWLWHQSTSWVLHGSSVWLGSVSVAIFLVSSKWGGVGTYFEWVWGVPT